MAFETTAINVRRGSSDEFRTVFAFRARRHNGVTLHRSIPLRDYRKTLRVYAPNKEWPCKTRRQCTKLPVVPAANTPMTESILCLAVRTSYSRHNSYGAAQRHCGANSGPGHLDTRQMADVDRHFPR